MTSITKLNILKSGIQITKLSKTLEVELTTKDRVFGGFWNNCSKEISKKLWYPQVTDFQGLVGNSLSGCSISSEENLQSSIIEHLKPLNKNSQKISWKSLPFSPPDITAGEDIKTWKVRFYPNKEQRTFLDKCFYVHRYFYNQSVEYTKTNHTTSDITIKNNLKIKNNALEHQWMKDVPFDTRNEAIRNFVGSYKASLELRKKGYIKHFDMKFLTKKDNNVCYMSKNTLKDITKNNERRITICKRKIKSKLNFRNRDKIDNLTPDGIYPITQDKSGKYYICLVKKYKNKPSNIESKDEFVALDPGVRTFQTYFSQQECGTIGDKMNLQVRKLNTKIDKLEALKAVSRSKTRYNLNKRCLLLRSKITNKVNDLHWKTASFLTKRYKVIFLPNFRVKQLCMKNPNKKVNREMCNLSHYKFKERIKYKAKLNNCTVIDCCESYTSKTCTNCGVLNDVGSKKLYHCKACKKNIDRDLNGARNIFIRCLTKYSCG